MDGFVLDAAFAPANIVLGRTRLCHVLVADNAAVPWFVLVPETAAEELCDLDAATHAILMDEVHHLGRALRARFVVDKLNVAAIGNVVRQLHVHVVGRRREDYCWPGVVWGQPAPARLGTTVLAAYRAWLTDVFHDRFTPLGETTLPGT
jgi:diadenosine tetraphosphate (Ap4A) HIT family hydrolase